MFIRYKGHRIAPSRSAMRELIKEEKTLLDVKKILEQGHPAPRKRKQDIIEKWLNKGTKTYNTVITKSYDEIMKEPIWVLIHFGKFTKKK